MDVNPDRPDDSLDATFWDQRYRSRSAVWSGEPNPQLVTEISALVPGTALDAGCGEGADAIWLAERGWRVTAADISAVALERARAMSAQISADVVQRIAWLNTNLLDWQPPGAFYDLISMQFMQLSAAPRNVLIRRLAAGVKPRGSLLIVGHHPSDLQTTVARPPKPELFYTAADIAALLDRNAWDVVVEASRERSTTDAAGRTVTIHDAVLHARRHA